MSGGRSIIAGDSGVRDFIDQRNVLNRTIRAQIIAVDHENGFVRMNYDGYPGGDKAATVPPLWMSFPKVGGAAWGRFMPQPSDICKISFDYDDRPRIVGYDVVANKDGVADGHSGWPHLHALHNRAVDNPSATINTNSSGVSSTVGIAKFAQFTPLYPGEYDFMSSGGAYIHGNRFGKLYMAGGAVSISLIKDDLSMHSMAQVYKYTSDNCVMRFGQVRRVDEASQLEKKLAMDSTGSYREFAIKLNSSLGVTSVNLASLQLGNVVVDNGDSTEKLNGSDLRFMLKTHKNGIESFAMKVNESGDCEMASSIGSSMKFNYPTGSFTGQFGTGFTIQSSSINLQGPMLPATHPLILSNIYGPAECTVIAGLAAQITALSGLVAAIATLLQAGGAASTPPVVGAIVMGKMFQAGAAPILTGAAAVTGTTPTLASAFINAYPSYYSSISRTG